MKYLIMFAFCFIAVGLSAQQKQQQYLLVIRSKANLQVPADSIKTNIQHWREFMGDLAKNGKISAGYRPTAEGLTIEGRTKTIKPTAYMANGEMISSFLIINAADLDEAKQIAAKCPVFELEGNVEIRSVQNTAN